MGMGTTRRIYTWLDADTHPICCCDVKRYQLPPATGTLQVNSNSNPLRIDFTTLRPTR